MGFRAVGRHRSKAVTLYRQGEINFIVNAEPGQPRRALRPGARSQRLRHGVPREGCGARPIGKLIALGAKPFHNAVGPMELNIPAIEGIGGSVIYLVDRYGEHSIYDVDFVPTDAGAGLRA